MFFHLVSSRFFWGAGCFVWQCWLFALVVWLGLVGPDCGCFGICGGVFVFWGWVGGSEWIRAGIAKDCLFGMGGVFCEGS